MSCLTFCETENQIIYQLDEKFGKFRSVFISEELLKKYQSEMSYWPKDRNKEFAPIDQFEELLIRVANTTKRLVGGWDVKQLRYKGERILIYLRTEDLRIFGLIKDRGEVLLTHIYYTKRLKHNKADYQEIGNEVLDFAVKSETSSYCPKINFVDAVNAKR